MLNKNGFTLIELMITVAMSGIIIAAVYATYAFQQKTYVAQDQVVEMQQNIRAATYSLVREIRMAGYDPTSNADSAILVATVSGISFDQDIGGDTSSLIEDGDGDLLDLNETIVYGFALADDANGDGVVDNGDGVAAFRRDNNSGGVPSLQAIAENIQAIELLYVLEDDTETTSPSTAQLADIRAVRISILARAGDYDSNFVNTESYTPASGNMWDLNGSATAGTGQPTNDSYRRRLLITTVQCRNMGI